MNNETPDHGLDPEIYAMHMLSRALEPLERDARQRVLDYARKRFLDVEHSHAPVSPLVRSHGAPLRPVLLDDLGLFTNALGSLKSFMQTEGLADLSDFRYVPESVLLRLRGMGDKSLKDFKAALGQVGVALGVDFPRGAFVNDWKMYMQRAKAAETEAEAETVNTEQVRPEENR